MVRPSGSERKRPAPDDGKIQPPTPASPERIARWLRALVPPGEVVELRAVKVPGYGKPATYSGFYSDLGAMARGAAELSMDSGKRGAAKGVYLTLNPVLPELLARRSNRYGRAEDGELAGDKHVGPRRWLLVDVDPVRDSHVSATESEKSAALEALVRLNTHLRNAGWPQPIQCDSGNGYHGLYRIDLPNNDESRDLVKGCLEALAARFDNDRAKIDKSVFNASRIVKLPGTVGRKGDHVPDRPHRVSCVLSIPDVLDANSPPEDAYGRVGVVPVELLLELAAEAPQPGARQAPRKTRTTSTSDGYQSRLDVPRWLAVRGIEFKERTTTGDGRTVYAITCPFDPSHANPDAAVMQDADGAMSAKCFHDSCSGRGWQEFKRAIGEPDGEHYDPPLTGRTPGPEPRQANGQPRDAGTQSNAPPLDAIEALEVSDPSPWPEMLADAYHGLPGSIVGLIEPETESDPAGVLLQLLTMFGNAVGRGPHLQVEGDRHCCNLFVNLVGRSSAARKGTSWGRAVQVMRCGANAWVSDCIVRGLISGEGVIHHVRDPRGKDEGVIDKRLMVEESEFASVLKKMTQKENTLSAVLRQAWQTGDLRTLGKVNPCQATGAHISVVGHITQAELSKFLTNTETLNGFANRFLWACVRQSKRLPHGGRHLNLTHLGPELTRTIANARAVDEVGWTPEADQFWCDLYLGELGEDKGDSLYAAVVARAAPQTLRLAMIYALFDGSDVIDVPHLNAGLAVWRYCDASARRVFADTPTDPLAAQILGLLRAHPGGLTKTELYRAFNNREKRDAIVNALSGLLMQGKVRREVDKGEGSGRRAERWFTR